MIEGDWRNGSTYKVPSAYGGRPFKDIMIGDQKPARCEFYHSKKINGLRAICKVPFNEHPLTSLAYCIDRRRLSNCPRGLKL